MSKIDVNKMRINPRDVKVGDRYKNFRELCKAFHIGKNYHDAQGSTRKAILKRIEQYISYERDKQAFIVQEVYEEKKELDDKRKKRYAAGIKIILAFLLSNKDGECISMTARRWGAEFGLCSKLFDNNNCSKFMKEHKNSTYAHDYIQKLQNSIRMTVLSVFNTLDKEEFISFSEDIMLIFNTEAYLADVDKKIIVKNIEQDVLEKMGYSKKLDVIFSGYKDKYYDAVVAKLNKLEAFSGLLYYYTVFSVYYSSAEMMEYINANSIVEADVYTRKKEINENQLEKFLKKEPKMFIENESKRLERLLREEILGKFIKMHTDKG